LSTDESKISKVKGSHIGFCLKLIGCGVGSSARLDDGSPGSGVESDVNSLKTIAGPANAVCLGSNAKRDGISLGQEVIDCVS